MRKAVKSKIKKLGTKVEYYSPRFGKRRVIGHVFEKTFYKLDIKPRHYMRQMSGYGIQEHHFQQLLKLGVELVVVEVVESDGRSPAVGDYVSRLSQWADEGIRTADRGDGEQRFLPVRLMSQIAEDGTFDLPEPAPPPPPKDPDSFAKREESLQEQRKDLFG